MTLVLYTSLDVDECVERLTAAINPERYSLFSSSRFAGSKPVIGRIDNGAIRLHKRGRVRNSFAPVFYGTLNSEAEGTVINGRFSMYPLVKILLVCSLVGTVAFEIFFVGLLSVLSAISVFLGSQWERDPWDGVAPVLIMPLIGLLVTFGVVLLGRYLSRDERYYILVFLMEALDAERIGAMTS